MREIKFRAWKPINSNPNDMRMDYTPQFFAEDGNGLVTINGLFASPIDYYEDSYTDPSAKIVLMQFTGMHDVNGREIYEGDILEFRDWVSTWDDSPTTLHAVVDWDERSGIWLAGTRILWKVIDHCHGTVVGNRYENPELMEVAEHE
ncbi:YopX family protein [Lacticaseibacillus salsurivasis]|uniref:YopX family protein n=1 Tax=Lacticaseibacillus salsurivasis TaxID=3081441 RepID=UPI0030C6C96D